jgi:hypothetical protein
LELAAEFAPAYAGLLGGGTLERLVAEVLAGRHRPGPPLRRSINKAGKHKKVVYTLEPADELLSRVFNRLLQPRLRDVVSPNCHSFLPGRGVITAFESLLRTPGLETMAWLHLDITDFFNSIDVEDLLLRLPPEISDEPVLMAFLERLLRGRRVVGPGGEVAVDEHKGVMAGTPLAPLLTNLYLGDLDDELASVATSVRYSDDILVLGDQITVAAAERLIRSKLAVRRLRVNEAKTGRGGPGEPWEYLGLRYHAGRIGLSYNTMRKQKNRVRRRARSLMRLRLAGEVTAMEVCERFAGALNRKLFGVVGEDATNFCWARWFFPLLSADADLRALDAFTQREIRFAATGNRRDGARSQVSYQTLRRAGYVPLVAAYHRYRRTGRFL